MEPRRKMNFLTRLELSQFSLSRSKHEKSPSSQADARRDLFLHLTEGRHNEDSPEALLLEADRNKDAYANIVDNMDESGLNNYAAGALSLCHYHKNESSKWQTSLSSNSLFDLPCFQAIEKTKRVDKLYNPALTVPLKRKRVIEKGFDDPSMRHPSSMLSGNSLSTVHQQNRIPSMPSNSHQFDNYHHSRIVQGASTPHSSSSSFKENHSGWKKHHDATSTGWKKHQDATSSDFFRKQQQTFSPGVSNKSSSAEAIFKLYNKSESRESISISTSKVGGPYANFGQKPKKGQNKWDYGKKEADKSEDDEELERPTPFRTARDQFIINQQKKNSNGNDRYQVTGSNYGAVKRSLGTRRGPANKFVPPVLGQDADEGEDPVPRSSKSRVQNSCMSKNDVEEEELVDERLKGIDPKMIEMIKNDIMDQGSPITWTDIAGLEFAKKTIQEIVVWPMLRPDIFTGLRGPPKGLLLFGPPGTGKTLIGKCIASQSKSTFFCISASSLTSKWVGEGEKMVRALFAVARCSQPAVVFIDEVDSLLSQRSDSEHESSRRIKTEFLVQLDGASTASDERLLVIGATNRPQEIDEAARRRFVKRLLIPLPENVARKQIIVNLVSQQNCDVSPSDLDYICDKTDGYSGADMSNLCREAALGPIRSIPFDQMETITSDQVRPMLLEDFEQALLQVRASVSPKDLELYTDWNKTYGSFGQ